MAEQDLTGNTYELPECWAEPIEISGNPVRQLLVPSVTVTIEAEAGADWAVTHQTKWRVIRNGDDPRTELAVSLQEAKEGLLNGSANELEMIRARYLTRWKDVFSS